MQHIWMLQLVLNSLVFGHRLLGHFIGRQSQSISVRFLQLNVVYCCKLDFDSQTHYQGVQRLYSLNKRFPPSSCIWSLALSSLSDHSTIKCFTFWCNVSRKVHTTQIHIVIQKLFFFLEWMKKQIKQNLQVWREKTIVQQPLWVSHFHW